VCPRRCWRKYYTKIQKKNNCMKKILIVNNNMHIGGVQKSLVNMLNHISDKYDVTLMLFSAKGEYMNRIPRSVKVIQTKSLYRYIGLTGNDVKKYSLNYLLRSFFAAITRLSGRKYAVSLMALSRKNTEKYDVAISFLHDAGDNVFYGGCNDFVLQHAVAERKITFLHCDYAAAGADTASNAERYKKFDNIIACSQGCRDSFLNCLPELSDKVKVVYNFHDFEEIKQLSEKEKTDYPLNYINIVTVARLGKEKAVLRGVKAVNSAMNRDKIKYHIIGDGIERKSIEKYIENNNLRDRVFIYGQKDNPYPYIKAADLLLIPSVSEAAPMVIGEAAYLGVPVISTKTSSAVELIERKGYGWVCENSEEGITSVIDFLTENTDLIEKVRQKLKNEIINNSIAENEINKILEERGI